jgi:hypothetical protein
LFALLAARAGLDVQRTVQSVDPRREGAVLSD